MARKKPVTSFDVAKKAGVSRSTVSIVINNIAGITISEKTKQAVWDAVRELNYYPDAIARSMRSNRSSMLGLVVGMNPTSPFLSHLLAGIQETATANKHCIVLGGTGLDEQKIEYYASMYLRKQVDGFIVALYTSVDSSDFLVKLKEKGVPLVVVNGGFVDTTIGQIHIDHELGAYEATMHLIRLGHSRVACLGPRERPEDRTMAHASRLSGYLKAMDEAGLEPICGYLPGGTRLARRPGYEAGKDLLESYPDVTACYCLRDFLAFGLLDVARELGRKVPRDLAIVGNDNDPASVYVSPALTTVAPPFVEAGRAATTMLIGTLADKDDIPPVHQTLPCKLIIRESCGAQKPGL